MMWKLKLAKVIWSQWEWYDRFQYNDEWSSVNFTIHTTQISVLSKLFIPEDYTENCTRTAKKIASKFSIQHACLYL